MNKKVIFQALKTVFKNLQRRGKVGVFAIHLSHFGELDDYLEGHLQPWEGCTLDAVRQ